MNLPKPLADIAHALEAQRSLLIASLAEMSDTQALRNPGAEQWSVSQLVEHLLLAEGFTVDLTKMMIERAQAAGQANGFPADLEEFEPLGDPISLEAPAPIQPRQERTPAELIRELNEMADRTKASLEALTLLDPREHRMYHPLFGELHLGHWWAVHPVHYAMHIEQAQGVLAGGQ